MRQNPLLRGQVLIVGYGNPLRGDDGLGWRAAERLRTVIQDAGVEILALHQLTPELMETLPPRRSCDRHRCRRGLGPPVSLLHASCHARGPAGVLKSALRARPGSYCDYSDGWNFSLAEKL
jgi:hypothetical protein